MAGSVTSADVTNLVRDAHYHPIRATATWAAFVADMADLAIADPEERKRRSEQRARETTYARGELGRH